MGWLWWLAHLSELRDRPRRAHAPATGVAPRIGNHRWSRCGCSVPRNLRRRHDAACREPAALAQPVSGCGEARGVGAVQTTVFKPTRVAVNIAFGRFLAKPVAIAKRVAVTKPITVDGATPVAQSNRLS